MSVVSQTLRVSKTFRVYVLLLALSFALGLFGCGYVRTRVTVPALTPSATSPVRLRTPEQRATSTVVPSTPLPTPTHTATPTPVIHVVVKGDNLLAISYQYDVSLEALIEANGIENPRLLSIGQRLLIPREGMGPAKGQPTPTPTPMPLRIVGLAFHRTPVGSLWCLGEVQNERDEFLELVQLRVTLYNVDGERVDEAEGFTVADIVPGLGRAPFALLFPNPPASGYASYEVAVVGGEPVLYWGGRHRELVVEGLEAEMEDLAFRVVGEVVNAGQENATDVELTITAYDEEGQVVGVRQVALDPLPADERRAFEVVLVPAAPAVRAEAVAWGMRASTSSG
jgi:LysM repeat protein